MSNHGKKIENVFYNKDFQAQYNWSTKTKQRYHLCPQVVMFFPANPLYTLIYNNKSREWQSTK